MLHQLSHSRRYVKIKAVRSVLVTALWFSTRNSTFLLSSCVALAKGKVRIALNSAFGFRLGLIKCSNSTFLLSSRFALAKGKVRIALNSAFGFRLGLIKCSNSAQSRNRTSDTRIFSPLLYRLSYLGSQQYKFYRTVV